VLRPSGVLLAFGCAAPSGVSAPEPTATVGAGGPGPSAEPTAAPTVAPTAAPESSAPASEDDARLLARILSGELPAYKVTYTMTTSGQGQSSSVTWTQVHSPPRYRFDMTTSEGGVSQTIITIVTEEGFYLCMDAGEKTCLEFPSAEEAAMFQAPQAPQPIPEDLAGWNVAPHETRSILGVTARCYTFRAPVGSGDAASTGCYSPDGVPLLISSTADGVAFTMTATAFSTNVGDADFELPYPVSKLPGYEAP